MAKRLSDEQIQMWARAGAEARLRELKVEIATIRGAFPGLEKPNHRDANPKRVMSAKARRAISRAQKARWKKQKATMKKPTALFR